MTIVTDHPMIDQATSAIKKLNTTIAALETARDQWVQKAADSVATAGVAIVRTPQSYLPKTMLPGDTGHVLKLTMKSSGYTQFHILEPETPGFAHWTSLGLGTGPHYTKDDPETGGMYLGEYVLLGIDTGDAMLALVAGEQTDVLFPQREASGEATPGPARLDLTSTQHETRTCDRAECVDTEHGWFDGEFNDAHQLAQISCADGLYTIYAYDHEDGKGWHVSLSMISDSEDLLTLDHVQALAADFATQQARCDAANAAEVTA